MPEPITLPDGYRLYEPNPGETQDSVQGRATSDAKLYGGATMNWKIGGDGKWRLGCCAEKNGLFCYRVFTLEGSVLVEIPLSNPGTGRGELAYDLDGYICWSSWEGSTIRPENGPARVPGVPPIPVGGGGAGPTGGTYVPINPNAYSASLDGQSVTGGRAIDVPSLYGLPTTSRAYAVRFVAQAAEVNIRARLGSQAQPGQLTVNTQQPNLPLHMVGIVNAADSAGSLWLSVSPDGKAAQVWLTIVGYFT